MHKLHINIIIAGTAPADVSNLQGLSTINANTVRAIHIHCTISEDIVRR